MMEMNSSGFHGYGFRNIYPNFAGQTQSEAVNPEPEEQRVLSTEQVKISDTSNVDSKTHTGVIAMILMLLVLVFLFGFGGA